MFELLATDPTTKARRGRLTTAHGTVETPVFMPVGTQGTVKTLHPEELKALGAGIILGNTYHLFLRPGTEIIRALGGLHRFANWDRAILTDSGGFQVFSLAKLRRISEAGVHFQSHIDGSPLFIGPEEAMEIQAVLGSDIAMAFDECAPYPCERAYAEESTALTTRWAERCRRWIDLNAPEGQRHFAIVQGSVHADLRRESARALADLDFPGYAIGGLSVGEPEGELFAAVEHAEPLLPPSKPRYAMGLGTPTQLLELVARGIDMFDCVMPTRLARHGTAITEDGPINLKNARFRDDASPLAPRTAPLCEGFSRAYVHHLLKAGEILALRLISLHNVFFYLDLMARARSAIEQGCFAEFRDDFTARYRAASSMPDQSDPGQA